MNNYTDLSNSVLKFAVFEGAIIQGNGPDFTDSYWHQTVWTDGEGYDTIQDW